MPDLFETSVHIPISQAPAPQPPSADPLGIDLAWDANLQDVDFSRLLGGRANLAAAIARRLITPRGALWYDPTYGFDLREYLKESLTPETIYEIETLTAQECEKDPRVLEAQAEVQEVARGVVRVAVQVATQNGPFRLVLAADEINVIVLEVR